MHPFDELVKHCTEFNLNALNEAQRRIDDELQSSAATSLVKAAQMVRMQKVISAVGMFSIFDAVLQDEMKSANGFRSLGKMLENMGKNELKERFNDLCLAINVLKHGRGSSYEKLVMKADVLPFRIKLPGEVFIDEGDITEISTLVEVDDDFLLNCANVIGEVALVKQAWAQSTNSPAL